MAQSSRPNDGRPDPDALLAALRRETAGRLKVFLGAAPGVGKTFAMLQNARRLKQEGVDIVIGLVETHGRAETSALVEGLEVLPRRKVEYHGRTIEEFDLDAALARKPKLIVVDELAHTNAPDSRHPKRWQDVQELLAAGVDVWTALNIQHLESLADVVSRISGVVVRETVPDRVLQEASDVVLVDLTPDELIQRLNEGKVYVPETARRAIQSFFTPGNLTALRELALRRTADRVDDQMVDYLRQKAIEGPWAASERLLACVGPDEVSERVVRRASQLATGLNAAWTAVTVETIGQAGDARRAIQLAKVFSLAERLGGDSMRLQGSDYPSEIMRLARRENVTQIVLGQSRAGLLRRIFGRSLPEALMRHAGGIEIHIVPGDEKQRPSWPRLKLHLNPKGLGVELVVALASVACAVAVGEALSAVLRLPNLSMIFLAAVLFSGVQFGTRAAVLASLASVFAYNFFFIQPIYTFTVTQPHELFALLIFLAVAVLTGSLTGRVRDQRETVIKNAEVTQSLYEFSRKLSGASSADDVLWAAAGASARHVRRPHRAPRRRGGRTANSRRLAARRPARRRRSRRGALGAAEKGAGGVGNRHAPARPLSVSAARRLSRADRRLRLRAAFGGRADLRGGRARADRDSRSDRDCARSGVAGARGAQRGDHAGKREGAGRAARLALA